MDVLVKIAQFILSFSLLVIIHELGHFMFARLFKIRVEKFYLFFNPWFSLFKFKRGDTEYGIGWVPFGGYVKIAGMIDESMDTEQMKQPAKDDEFRSKPAWQRLLVMVGGVCMNIVLALAIYIGMSYVWGEKYIANEDLKYGYAFNEFAEELGFQDGDKIISVDGEVIVDYNMIYPTIVINQASTVEVLRNGEEVVVNIPEEHIAKMLSIKPTDFMFPRRLFIVDGNVPGESAEKAGVVAGDTLIAMNGLNLSFSDEFAKEFAANKNKPVQLKVKRDSLGTLIEREINITINEKGQIGVLLSALEVPIRTTDYTIVEAVPAGFNLVGDKLVNYWNQLKLMFNPETEAYKSLGGVIAIGNIFPNVWNWESFWGITAFLSIVLAVMNILPIPALDGGHVIFLLYEVIARRKPSDKFMEVAQTVGVIILFSLLIFANANDIYRFFIK